MYATRGLAETLCDLARDAEPEAVTISLATTLAGEFHDSLPPETPVFTHFYFPDAGRSLSAVFGIDLGTPVGQTQGRFVSHPQGKLALSRTDDLHGVVFVAVPPWGTDELAVFSRNGIEKPLELLDAEPPAETLD